MVKRTLAYLDIICQIKQHRIYLLQLTTLAVGTPWSNAAEQGWIDEESGF